MSVVREPASAVASRGPLGLDFAASLESTDCWDSTGTKTSLFSAASQAVENRLDSGTPPAADCASAWLGTRHAVAMPIRNPDRTVKRLGDIISSGDKKRIHRRCFSGSYILAYYFAIRSL